MSWFILLLMHSWFSSLNLTNQNYCGWLFLDLIWEVKWRRNYGNYFPLIVFCFFLGEHLLTPTPDDCVFQSLPRDFKALPGARASTKNKHKGTCFYSDHWITAEKWVELCFQRISASKPSTEIHFNIFSLVWWSLLPFPVQPTPPPWNHKSSAAVAGGSTRPPAYTGSKFKLISCDSE